MSIDILMMKNFLRGKAYVRGQTSKGRAWVRNNMDVGSGTEVVVVDIESAEELLEYIQQHAPHLEVELL